MATLVLALHQSLDASAPLQQSSLLAYDYAQAALLSGHQILQVFFYHEAVKLAEQQPSDLSVQKAQALWQQLAKSYHFDLVYCATIAERELDLAPDNIAAGFTGAGVTEFAQAVARANHVIQF